MKFHLIFILSLISFGQAGAEVTNWAPFFWQDTGSEYLHDDDMQVMGPLYEQWYRKQEEAQISTFRPLWTDYHSEKKHVEEFFVFPPLFHYYKDSDTMRWEFFSVIKQRKTGYTDEGSINTFMLFPFFFYHDMPQRPERSYLGVMPFYGSVRNFLGISRISWAMFPFYVGIERGGVTRNGYIWPFFQTQSGTDAGGWAFWPLMGHLWKGGEYGYDYQYALWPLIYRKVDQFDKKVSRVRTAFIPFYAFEHSETVTDVTYAFPFFGWRIDTEKQYRESRYLWPIWVQGRGPDTYINRWGPFYTHSIHGTTEKTWYAWPFLRFKKWKQPGLDIESTKFFYFLYFNETQRSQDNPDLPAASITHVWPFLSTYDNGAGLKQMQMLSPIEVFYPYSKSIRDTYSALFSLFRYQSDVEKGKIVQTAFWGFFRQVTQLVAPKAERIAPEKRARIGHRRSKMKFYVAPKGDDYINHFSAGFLIEQISSKSHNKIEFLKGLLGYECKDEEERFSLFWIDL